MSGEGKGGLLGKSAFLSVSEGSCSVDLQRMRICLYGLASQAPMRCEAEGEESGGRKFWKDWGLRRRSRPTGTPWEFLDL